MPHTRWLKLFLLFVLLQLPLVLFFSKKASFEEYKWKMVVSELIAITFSVGATFFLSQSKPSLSQTSTCGKQIALPKMDLHNYEDTQTALKELKEQKTALQRILDEVQSKNQQLEIDIASLRTHNQQLQEESTSAKAHQTVSENARRLIHDSLQKISQELFHQFEEIQELRRQHAIELRALLRKDSAIIPKESTLTDKKTGLSFLPRNLHDPVLLLLLIHIFAKKLSASAHKDPEASSLLRRKFLEELRVYKAPSCMCLSIETCSENYIPTTCTQNDARILLEWIRTNKIENDLPIQIAQNVQETNESWYIVRLPGPFFKDLFLCAKNLRNTA